MKVSDRQSLFIYLFVKIEKKYKIFKIISNTLPKKSNFSWFGGESSGKKFEGIK
jgi:hypothetical protein